MPWLGILGISHIICGLQCVHVCVFTSKKAYSCEMKQSNSRKMKTTNSREVVKGKERTQFFCTMTYSYSEYWAVLHPGFLHCLLWINTLYEALFGTHEYGAPCRWEEWRVYNSVLLMRLPIAENEPTLLG